MSYYSRLHDHERDTYVKLCDHLSDRYGRKAPPHTLRHQLQSIKQLVDEDLESYAERVQQLAYDALDLTIQDAAVDAFLRGCEEKRAAFSAMERAPNTLNQAIGQVKNSFHNQKALYGESSKLRQVAFADEGVKLYSVKVTSPPSRPNPESSITAPQIDQLTTAMQQLTKILESQAAKLADTERYRDPRGSSNSPSRSGAFSPRRSGTFSPTRSCSAADYVYYECGVKGHFARQCPTLIGGKGTLTASNRAAGIVPLSPKQSPSSKD